MFKMSIKEIIKATNGQALILKSKEELIIEISTSSKEIEKSTLFIPIIGETKDGHNYMEDAYANGCRNFLIDKDHTFIKDDINLIQVDNTTHALGDIAKFYKEQFNIPYIGITGSVGKTSTKDMIESVLSEKYNTLKTEGNHNNEIGLPKTLFNLNEETQVCVLEMGMSFKGEIEYLANIVRPDIAVISNIGMSHIEHFLNQIGIFDAKMEITKYFNENNTLIVNGDDDFLGTLRNKKRPYKLLTYGFNDKNDIYCNNYTINEKDINFTCVINSEEHEFLIPTIAKHNILNAMAAILVGLKLNLSFDQIKEGLSCFQITRGRLTIINKKDLTIIDDTYNASADSMISALNVLKEYKTRRVAILGDILETGKYEEELHRKVGQAIKNNCDLLLLVGNATSYIKDEAIKEGFTGGIYRFDKVEDLLKSIDKLLCENDTVLIKASHGIGLHKVVAYLDSTR